VRLTTMVMSLIMVAVLPASTANFAMNGAHAFANLYSHPLPDEPELVALLVDNIGLAVGKPFRGASGFWMEDSESHVLENRYSQINLWIRGVPTVEEYSQLVTPQSTYFVNRVFNQNVLRLLNTLFVLFRSDYSAQYWKGVQLFGLRYIIGSSPFMPHADEFPLMTLPHRRSPAVAPETKHPGTWYIYELPRPNLGDYSPTEVVTAQTGAKITAAMAAPNFDFTRQVVVSEPINGSLVPAHDMQVAIIRNGLHVSGKSDGTSLVVLPYQFSNCLRPRDRRVRLVRTNLMMAGLLFSGDLDTDIVFDYGLFSPACRRADLADMRQLDLKIDLRMPHLSGDRLFPDWDGAVARLRTAARALKLDNAIVYVPVIGPLDLSL